MENAGSIGIGVVLGLVTKNASAVGKIVKDFNNLEKVAAKTKLGISGLQKQLDTLKLNSNLREELKAQRKGLQDEIFTLGNLISSGIVGKSIKVGIDFESAMADVKKVTELSEGHSLKDFKQDIIDLTKKLPMSAEEIAKIVSEGGKLGLASKEALEFGKTATAMGVAFEMGADEAGEAIGGLMANLQTDVKGIKDLGDSINYLADKGSSDAKNIVDIISRIGGMGNLVGLQRENMAALAATLDEVKIPAEVAGTAISNMFVKLSTADSLGEKAEEAFMQLGLSGEFMKKALNKNSQEAIDLLLSRIKMLDKESQIGVMTNIFGVDQGTIRSITTLMNNYDRYQELLKMANSEEKKGSMDKELANKCDTTAAALKILGNNITAIAIKFSDALLPVVKSVALGFSFVANIIDTLLSNFPVLSTIIATATVTFLLAKPAILAYAFAKNYVKDSTLLFKNALIAARIHLLAFANSCNISKISLIGKALALKLVRIRLIASVIAAIIYKKAVIGLNLALANLSKAFINVARYIKFLTITMLTSPLGIALAAIGIIAGVIIANWDKVKIWFVSFIEWLKPIFEPIANIFNSIWQGISDFFYSIFGGMFEWFGDKLSWISEAIASVGNFINDVLGFFGLNDDEVKVSTNKQSEEKIINAYGDELPQTNEILETKSIKQIPINSTPSFNNGSINVTVNGTFNIATKDGNFNMQEFATAIQKSIFDALRKQEQNKINTTIYG
ncbi:phage tail tape measure protein, TP901 family [Campylobacter subantarcticus LMG 24377]|uniref:Phage tail tape measure protein n=1 Tax=Campylobacter subantarcticus TaxID=497724 RepID=A0ABW9N7G4_9BACT|nr:phage tail tape measure protein [Campylobacter subantarcticus]AJC92492.1 phage tail tape measure protein, TP901 family [Campylobacter subantarcticus LMG 24377]EAL3939505.1 phage tail tape measure protein [Campylobacter lari]MPC00028.1 phage tail tape measure protein [Campylobacter subantarcticus]